MIFNAGGPMFATGAPVTGFNEVGSFFVGEVVPGTNNCTYGDIAIGPAGQIMQVCTLTESGQGGGKLFVNVDPDGLGPANFGDRIFVTDTHVGGFDFIAPQPDRSVDAEPGLAWDRTGGPHNGRAYLIYTKEQQNESDNTDIYVRYSDDGGATWSSGVRVNDDSTVNSQFLPKISLDPTTGNLAAVWYDSPAPRSRRESYQTAARLPVVGSSEILGRNWLFTVESSLTRTPELHVAPPSSE